MTTRRYQRSPEADLYRSFYKTARWRKMRDQQLQREPLCTRPVHGDQVVSATIANHRIPHRGDLRLFFDPTNLQSTCKPCHDAAVQRSEARGFDVGVDAGGRPIASDHPWNRPPGLRNHAVE